MITASFFALLGLVTLVALSDWRRAWLLLLVVATIQDPVRKVTPGTPVWISFAIIGVYAAILFMHQDQFRGALSDFSQRFASIWGAFGFVALALAIAAVNGLMTFGLSGWKAPILSLFTYVAPIPAVILGYAFLDREERLFSALRLYVGITSVALVGSLLEYLRMDWRTLGLVAQPGDYIRHLPGIQIRMISGFYRGPDVMATHAAMVTAIAIAMVVRSGVSRMAWIWLTLAGWGFFNCMISGRRKAIYFVVVFAAVFLWSYFRRLNVAQFVAILVAGLVIFYVVRNISQNERTSAYAKGAIATRLEFAGRIEGGVIGTLKQTGVLGEGLGTATQGVYHVVSNRETGWQEGGLGKLARELGVHGLAALALLGAMTFSTMRRISVFPDEPASSQLARVTLFGLVMAHVANFVASAQVYSDAYVTLLAAFFAGSLFATATLQERHASTAERTTRGQLAYSPAS